MLVAFVCETRDSLSLLHVRVVLALLPLPRGRGDPPFRAALVRRALRLAPAQVLELYQIAPFVLQLRARAAPVGNTTRKIGQWVVNTCRKIMRGS